MKIRHAELLLKLMRRNKTLTAPVSISTDEGVLVTGLPMGIARGAWNLRNMVTIWPKSAYSALFQGAGVPHHLRIPRIGTNVLWDQEGAVYLRERQEGIQEALASLSSSSLLPRPGEWKYGKINNFIAYDTRPHAEDFGDIPMKTEKYMVKKNDRFGNCYFLSKDLAFIIGLKDLPPGGRQTRLTGRLKKDGVFYSDSLHWFHVGNCWHPSRFFLLMTRTFGIRMCFFDLKDGEGREYRGWVHPKVLAARRPFLSTGYEEQATLFPADLQRTRKEAYEVWRKLKDRKGKP